MQRKEKRGRGGRSGRSGFGGSIGSEESGGSEGSGSRRTSGGKSGNRGQSRAGPSGLTDSELDVEEVCIDFGFKISSIFCTADKTRYLQIYRARDFVESDEERERREAECKANKEALIRKDAEILSMRNKISVSPKLCPYIKKKNIVPFTKNNFRVSNAN